MSQKVFKKLPYYLRIWLTVIKVSLSKVSAYRVEVASRILRGFLVLAVQVIFAKAIVGASNSYLGYTVNEIYLLSGIFNIIGYTSWSLFGINLGRLEEKIVKGDFDFVLFKPFSSIFGASFMEFFIDDAMTAISGYLLVGYYIYINFSQLTIIGVLMSIIAVICGILIWFSLDLIVASFDFIAIKTGIRSVRERANSIARFPMEIWNPTWQLIFYTVFPVALIGFLPMKILVDPSNWYYLIYTIFVSLVFVLFARSVWYWALKRYTSVG